jgi:hypothetical protein
MAQGRRLNQPSCVHHFLREVGRLSTVAGTRLYPRFLPPGRGPVRFVPEPGLPL